MPRSTGQAPSHRETCSIGESQSLLSACSLSKVSRPFTPHRIICRHLKSAEKRAQSVAKRRTELQSLLKRERGSTPVRRRNSTSTPDSSAVTTPSRASGISLQSEVADASSSAVKLKEALDEGKMSKRDLAEAAKAASALSDKLQELEIEAAASQNKLNVRLEALSAASAAGSLTVSSDNDKVESQAQVVMEEKVDEEEVWARIVTACEDADAESENLSHPTNKDTSSLQSYELPDGQKIHLKTEESIYELPDGQRIHVENTDSSLECGSPPVEEVMEAASTPMSVTPQQGEDFVLMSDEEYEVLQLAKARQTLVQLPQSLQERRQPPQGEASHTRWVLLLGVAGGLDALRQGWGSDAAWVNVDPLSERTWVFANVCFLLALYFAMRLD